MSRAIRREVAEQLARAQLELAQGDTARAGLFALIAAMRLIGLEPERAAALLERAASP